MKKRVRHNVPLPWKFPLLTILNLSEWFANKRNEMGLKIFAMIWRFWRGQVRGGEKWLSIRIMMIIFIPHHRRDHLWRSPPWFFSIRLTCSFFNLPSCASRFANSNKSFFYAFQSLSILWVSIKMSAGDSSYSAYHQIISGHTMKLLQYNSLVKLTELEFYLTFYFCATACADDRMIL